MAATRRAAVLVLSLALAGSAGAADLSVMPPPGWAEDAATEAQAQASIAKLGSAAQAEAHVYRALDDPRHALLVETFVLPREQGALDEVAEKTIAAFAKPVESAKLGRRSSTAHHQGAQYVAERRYDSAELAAILQVRVARDPTGDVHVVELSCTDAPARTACDDVMRAVALDVGEPAGGTLLGGAAWLAIGVAGMLGVVGLAVLVSRRRGRKPVQ